MSVVQKQHVVASHRPVQQNRVHSASPQADPPPVTVRANLTPASIEVASNLAEDTVIGGVMNIAPGRNKVAMFANPFADGAEEMLYIDEQRNLRWARHVNAPNADVKPEELNGWSIDIVHKGSDLAGVAEVVVAVHPNGSVWFFMIDKIWNGTCTLAAFKLVLDPSVLGGVSWALQAVFESNVKKDLQGLSVQYCSNRPATPIVFVTDPSEPRLYWYTPLFRDESPLQWHKSGEFRCNDADRNAPMFPGADGPEEQFSQGLAVEAVRLWTLVNGTLYVTSYLPVVDPNPIRLEVMTLGQQATLVGVWNSPSGAGVVAASLPDAGNPRALAVVPHNAAPQWLTLDQPLNDIVVWTDASNLLHLYGRAPDRSLNVVHQLGWKPNPMLPPGWVEPAWDQHTDTQNTIVTTTRPLVGEVATFAVDPFPDDLPSQHVMHQGKPPGESCAIYTQSVRTNFWCKEQVRLIPKTLPAPYTVPRYQTRLIVKDSYAAPMSGVPVSLTADVPVDLEVDGRFYRTGSNTPVTLTTDLRGQITLRVVASGLSVSQMYATAPGLSQAATVQMAADVHKFLAGNGTLPNHAGGFNATTVESAKKADGTPLFPKIKKTGAAGDWPPSAADVVKWCRGAFSMDTGAALPAEMLAGLGAGEQVLAFTLQTHDPSRPGFQVYSRAEHLTAREQALAAKGSFLGEWEDWVGDVWQGIRQDVAAIGEVFVDVANRAIELVISFADGLTQRLRAFWDDIVSAAHAIEGAFVALGAKISEALEWLKWAFDFKDVWDTKTALEGSISVIMPFLKDTLDTFKDFGGGWLQTKEEDIRKGFATMRAGLGSRSIGGLQAPSLPDDKKPPTNALIKDRMNDPHVSWVSDKMGSAGDAPTLPGLPKLPGADTDPFTKWVTTLQASPGWADLGLAIDDMGELFTNLFNFSDPQTLMAKEMITILDLFEHVLVGLLEVGNSVLTATIEFMKDMIDLAAQLLATPIENDLVNAIYKFVQASAGISPDKIGPATIGGVGLLIASYAPTVLCKVVAGRPPFPGGKFPSLPFTSPEKSAAISYPGGVLIPPKGWEYLMTWQIFQGVMMALDGPYDVYVDATAYYDEGAVPPFLDPPAWFVQSCACAHWIAYALGDFPYLWGNTYPPNHPPDETALPYLSWALSAFVNTADVGCAFGRKTFLVKFDEDKTGVGPFTLTACGIARIIISALRYKYIGTQSSTDLLNMWINITSFESSASGFLRFLFRRNRSLAALMNVKVFADLVCDLFAGITTTFQTAYSNSHPPVIAFGGTDLPPATLHADYNHQFDLSGGWSPYSWEIRGVLPAGLSLDANTGLLSGQPKVTGDFNFRVQVTDYSGPSFTFLTDERKLTINK